MPRGTSTHDGSSGRADATATWMGDELLAALECGRASDAGERTTAPAYHALGPLAGLLIARWAGCDESEREAIAAFDEETFTPELPEALMLSAWDRPTESHASELAAGLREMTARGVAGNTAARYVARVAPLVIRAAERSRQTYERLHAWVGQIDLGSPDGRGLATRLFDNALRTVMATQGRLVGEFATPPHVAALMLELADPEPGNRVYDPCFGFGELLVGAARRLRAGARAASPRDWADVQYAGIFGVEIDPLSYAVGLCRTLLAGIDGPGLELTDTLERPLPRNRSVDGFDRILATPPWGGRTARSSSDQFRFPSRNAETLFLQHVMGNLRPGGRAVVALPEGSLFRLGSDREVRKALASEYSIDGVVSLPAGAFAPWTGISASLVVFRRAARRSMVRFVGISPSAWRATTQPGDDCLRDVDDNERRRLEIIEYESPDGGESGRVTRPGADFEHASGFGGRTGSGAEFEDGSGFGYGHGSDVGFGDGSGSGFVGGVGSGAGFADGTGFENGTAEGAGFDYGAGHGNGRMTRVELLRCVSDLIAYQPDLLSDRFLPGVDVWDVPIRDLARRDYELVAKKSGSDVLDGEIERLVATDRSLKIEPLERVVEVFTGRSYRRQYTVKDCDAADAMAGLIRAGDVKDIVDVGNAAGDPPYAAEFTDDQAPSLFLLDKAKTLVKEKEYLRPYDVVVSITGSIGNVAVFPIPFTSTDVAGRAPPASGFDRSKTDSTEPSVPLVATSTVAVLRARQAVTALFLAAVLRSPAYQGWLSGHARGTAIQRLTLRILRSLCIPVPPLPVQEAVLDMISELRSDAMSVLGRLLSGVASGPVAAWLETPLVARIASGTADGMDSDKFEALVAAAEALRSLVAATAHRADPAWSELVDRRIISWLGVAQQVVTALDGVGSIPRGAGRLAVLEVALSRMHEGLRVLDGVDVPTADRLRSFTRSMVTLAEGEVGVMQQSAKLEVSLEPAEVAVGAISEVQLRLTNASPVPLRSLHVSTRPPAGTGQLPYLADGETHRVPLTVHPRDATQPLPIVVSWRARRLDGTAVVGEVEVALRVLSTREVVRSGDLGASPYIVGNPVDRHEMFFGRTDILDRMQRQLGASTHANVILLEGNRRTGKTSILRQLGKPDVLPGWIPVYCSLQDAEGDDSRGGVTTRNVFKLLARTTGWSLSDAGVDTWIPGIPQRDPGRPHKLAFLSALNQAFAGEHAFETFELYLSAAVDAVSPRRVLLMLDEFDKLQEGIDAGITSSQVPENIRHLLQHQPGVSAIITGSRRLKRLREEYWSALFGLGYRIGISALSRDDARRLVTEPVEGRLAYLPQARDRLVELCACHPFLVQSLCNRVFEQAAATGASTVTIDAVQQAATEMVRDNEHFRTLWDYTGSARRGLVLALCDRLQDNPDAVNLDLLEVEFRKLGVSLRRVRDLADDVTELRELELLDFDESYRRGTYRLAVPLMAQWVQMNVDFDDLVVRSREEAMEARW